MQETRPRARTPLVRTLIVAVALVAALAVAIMLATPGSPLSKWLWHSPAPTTDPATAQFRTTADGLITAFRENEPVANSQFGGKRGEVSGKVVAVKGSGTRVEVQLGEWKHSFASVACRYHHSAASSAAALKPGDELAVIGTLGQSNSAGTLIMTDCVPVERK